MKKILAFFATILLSAPALAQVSYSTITGTVTDANSNPLANANIVATLVTTNGVPINGLATPNGQLFNGSPMRGTLDATGHFSLNLVPNSTLRQPSGSAIATQWLVTLSSPQDSSIITYAPAWNVSYQFTVSGNQDLSSQLSSLVTSPIAFVNTKTGQSTFSATGNLSASGTPSANQAPEWVDASHLKGVSASQFAVDMGIAGLASPTFTGIPKVPTDASCGANSMMIANETYVANCLATFAPLASPAFTGTPSAPTQTTSDSSTDLATDQFVHNVVNAAGFAPLASPSFTGAPTVPTPSCGTTGQIANEAYVAACAPGAGSLSASGTPTAGQAPEWVSSTQQKGVSGSQFATDMQLAAAPQNMIVQLANYTITTSGNMIQEAVSGTTVTLPSSPQTGFSAAVMNAAPSGTVTISPNGLPYDGVTSIPAGQSVYIAYDGSSYHSTSVTNYSGSGVTYTPSKTGNSVVISSAGLPAATDTKDKIAVNAAGAPLIITPATDEYNVVLNGGFDNTGTTDESTATANLIMTSGNLQEPIYFPAGTYNFNAGMFANCTASICGGILIHGAGKEKTVFQSNCSNGFDWWLFSTAVSGSYWTGPQIKDVSFKDTSGTGACGWGLRITQVANLIVENTEYDTFQGKSYATGNITVTNGSTTVTGSGTTFTSAMISQFNSGTYSAAAGSIGQALLIVNGTPQFVCAYVSATQLTLCAPWQGATTTTTAANQWDLSYGGSGLLLDGGPPSAGNYVQYGMITGTWASGALHPIGSVPQASGQGTSRFWIIGGFLNPLRYTDSMCAAFGDYTDTIVYDVACNNAAWGSFWENTHDNEIKGKVEQDGAITPIYSCNGGTASQFCTSGTEMVADTSGHGYGNSIHDQEVYSYGTALKIDSTAASYVSVYSNKWMNSGGASANLNDFNFMGVNGCPANASGNHATIVSWNCVHLTSTVGVN